MKISKLLQLLLLFISIYLYSLNVSADQKMIVLKGDNSYLMQGDRYKFAFNKPQEYGKSKVLPALLSIGWRIKSVHVNEKSTEDSMYGYLVLERDD